MGNDVFVKVKTIGVSIWIKDRVASYRN